MSFKKNTLIIFAILTGFFLFGLFVYPTTYIYDKLEQKYPVKINRFTGNASILTQEGWIYVENVSEISSDSLRKELNKGIQENKEELKTLINIDREELKVEIVKELTEKLQIEINDTKVKTEEIKKDLYIEVGSELEKVYNELASYQKFQTDPDNYFTIGDTKEKVKSIMGVPDKISDYEMIGTSTWNYDFSSIEFKGNIVSSYSNLSGNLRVK